MTTTQPAELPEHTIGKHDHPEPHTMCWSDLELAAIKRYAESYALAALQSQPAAEVSDEEISRLWSWSATAEAERTATTQQHAFAYALLPLRPQAVPMTDAPFLKVYKGSICYKSVADDQSYGMWCPVNWDTELGLKDGTVFYAHHGITAQGAQGGEG